MLQQIYGQLEGYGYEVWMSAMGTIPNFFTNHAFTDCLKAVESCDLFLSLITPRYGSVVDDVGITHQELAKAIDRKVPRWVMVHERVTLLRAFFNKLEHGSIDKRKELLDWLGYDDPDAYKAMVKRESNIVDDFRVVDMFDIASQQTVKPPQRQGNWVQPYSVEEDVRRYVNAQFGDYGRIEKQIEVQQNAAAKKATRAKTAKKARRKK